MPAKTIIQLRKDTAANWTSVNPVLAEGEAGLETDTGLVKYGNGTSTWTALPYPSNSNTTYLVRNNTGITIPKGTLVAATGAEPSGRIDVAPFETTGLQDSELRVMGVATANIASGVNGTVMSFGALSGIDTRGTAASALAVGDEDWAVGTILFAHPTVAGKLTSVRPKHDLAVAFTTVRHATAGQISVRILPGNKHLEWLHDVELDAPAAGQVLQYDGTDWVNGAIDLSSKQDTITGGATTIISSNLTASRALVSDGSGKVTVSDVTTTELGYVDGVTSAIQDQLDGKAATSHVHNASAITYTIEDKTANYTIVAADEGKVIRSTNAAITVTVADVFAIGEVVTFAQYGAGQVTFTPAGGVTLHSVDAKRKTTKQYSTVQIMKTAASTYLLFGDIAA